MSRTWKGKIMVAAGAALILAIWSVGFLPDWLATADAPLATQCVAVMRGQQMADRAGRAVDFVERGYADAILIPACRRELTQARSMDRADLLRAASGCSSHEMFQSLPWYVEQTWVELKLLKTMMQRRAMTSATIISHPLHLRRIRIMAASLFPARTHTIRLLPAFPIREAGLKRTWLLSVHETVKIVWYLVSSPFLRSNEGVS